MFSVSSQIPALTQSLLPQVIYNDGASIYFLQIGDHGKCPPGCSNRVISAPSDIGESSVNLDESSFMGITVI
jgi:hypothetical protein